MLSVGKPLGITFHVPLNSCVPSPVIVLAGSSRWKYLPEVQGVVHSKVIVDSTPGQSGQGREYL